jgi:NAD(P)-dependent dehydrogenase (short-subunit alcohol dehydrogenase family)
MCKQNYEVTIACRDAGKAAKALESIRAEVPGALIGTASLDLADLGSVRDCASRLLDSGKAIDVLLNNAGVMACPKMATKQGYEYQMGVNHLGHFLLTTSLLPMLQKSGR